MLQGTCVPVLLTGGLAILLMLIAIAEDLL
jgi:hypothetical protein